MQPSTRGWQLIGWITACTVTCTLILALRLWAAIIAKRRFYADDAIIIIAFVCTIIYEVGLIWGIRNGFGAHAVDVPPEGFLVQAKLVILSSCTWLPGTVLVKAAVVWMYTRIFSIQQFRRWAYAVLAIVAAYGVAFLAVFLSRCYPVSQEWDPKPWGHCVDFYWEQLLSITLNIVVDSIIIILPMPMLWGLKLPVRSKIAITLMFSLGLITIATMVWRLYFTVTTRHNTDFTWDLFYVGLISLLELWLGIVAATIPTLAPLIKKYIKPVIRTVTAAATKTKGSQGTARGDGPDASRMKRDTYYNRLDDSNSTSRVSKDAYEMSTAPGISTDCRHDPNRVPSQDMEENSIYIHHAITEERYETVPADFPLGSGREPK